MRLSDLRDNLTEDESRALNTIWRKAALATEWPLSRAIHRELGTAKAKQILGGLSGSIVLEQPEGELNRYELTLLGVLLTDDGPNCVHLLAEYLRLAKRLSLADPTVEGITSSVAESELGLAAIDTTKLKRLIRLAGLWGNSAGAGSDTWAYGLPREIDELWETDDMEGFVVERAMRKYDPALPVWYNQRLTTEITEAHPHLRTLKMSETRRSAMEERLRKCEEDAGTLVGLTTLSPRFRSWRPKVEECLAGLFGSESRLAREFGKLDFCVPAMRLNPGDWTAEDEHAYEDDLEVARHLIRDAILELGPEYSVGAVDKLTGLRPRPDLDAVLADAISKASEARPLSVVFADVDRFKQVNDTHGHGAGDRVLAEVSRRVADVVHGKGDVFRYGGEELVIVLPNFAREEGVQLAERARAAIEGAPVDNIAITASFGVACYPFDGADPATLLKAADGAMYDAKARGRNLVRAVGDGEPPAEKRRAPVRKAPVPGEISGEQKEDMRLKYFREGWLPCPRDEAPLKVHEMHEAGLAGASLFVACPACGFQEELPAPEG